MALLSDLLNTLPDGEVSQVIIGLHWTAVVTEVEDKRHCGLASTINEVHDHHNTPDVPNAGQLKSSKGLVLAMYTHSDCPVMRSVGVAAINALLPSLNHTLVEKKAENIIASLGFEKRVVLVGRFAFIPRLRTRVVSRGIDSAANHSRFQHHFTVGARTANPPRIGETG